MTGSVRTGAVVGFVGLGRMGVPMATRVAQAGYRVRAFDVSPIAGARLAGVDHVAVVDELCAVATGAAAVVLMLPDSSVVEDVVLHRGLLEALEPGTRLVDMSSSEPARTRRLQVPAAGRGVALLDAPVSGGVRGAVAGTLTVMVGGAKEHVDSVRPLLATMGSRVVRCGEVGAGHAVKALNNLMSAVHLWASSEAMLAARAFGLDPTVVLEVVNGSSGRSGSTENKWPTFVLTGRYDSGFELALMLKDMRIALGLAQACGTAAGLSVAAVDLWARAAGDLPEHADHTEIVRWLERQSRPPEETHATYA